MDQLSPQDAQFLYMESSDNHIHVTALAVFDPSTVPGGKTVRFKALLAHIEDRLHMSPMFRRKLERVPLELDFPYWVDDEDFDLVADAMRRTGLGAHLRVLARRQQAFRLPTDVDQNLVGTDHGDRAADNVASLEGAMPVILIEELEHRMVFHTLCRHAADL